VNAPPATIIVPTRDRPEMLGRALATLAAARRPGDEMIVVDSASVTPATADVARAHGATVVRCDLPGVNRARNAGWRAAAHDLLLYADDDVTVDAGWAEGLAAALEAHPTAAFVAGRIEIPAGQEDAPRPVAVRTGSRGERLTAESRGILGHSASLGVRRAALARVGGWDEALGAGGRFKSSPEVDLFDRLFAAGWEGWFEPSSLAWHDQWRDDVDLLRLDWRYSFGSGARIAKLLRTDRRRARAVAAEVVWEQGLRDAARNARRGYKTPTALALVRVVGAAAGLVRALPTPVRDGHFVLRG